MSDEKPPPSPPGSSSALGSGSQDALDSASVRELARALDGLRQSQEDTRQMIAAELRKGEFRERVVTNAMDRNTAAVVALTDQVRRSLKLNREVVTAVTTEERRVVEQAARRLDETGKHLTMPRETDEQVVTRVVVTRVFPWAVRRSVALKIFAAIVGGITAAWAALKAFAHRF